MQPIQPTNAGAGFLQASNGFLNNALNTWVQVEQLKAAKSSSGQDRMIAKNNPELKAGTAIEVDKPVAPQVDIKPHPYGKYALAAVAIIGAVYVLKRVKI